MGQNYIDIHSHILPGVDDGARDMEAAMEMVDMAYGQGVRTMVATPHYYPGHMRHPREHLEGIYRETVSVIKERYSDFTLLLGNEVYYRDEAVEKLKNKRILTMAGTNYVLLEFSPSEEYGYICKAVYKCLENGYYPVLAHMERYGALWKDEKRVRELTRMGAYMQVNAENFQEGFFSAGRRYCLKLLQSGLAHFIGSDCHNTQGRSPNLKHAMDYLKEKLEPELFHKLTVDNPAKLLDNKYI